MVVPPRSMLRTTGSEKSGFPPTFFVYTLTRSISAHMRSRSPSRFSFM